MRTVLEQRHQNSLDDGVKPGVTAVHRAYTRKGCRVLVAGPSGRQSGEVVLKAEAMLGTMGIAAQGDGNNDRSLLLPNGSRIVGLSENPGKK